MTDELDLARGRRDSSSATSRAEFPGLRLDWVSVAARRRASPRVVKRRLSDLSNRYRGANVVAMRTQPIPHAYRAFFRQIGLDPDVDRIPSEEVAVARLLHGGVPLRGPRRRRAADRADRDRRAGVGDRRRASSTRAGSGSARASPAIGSETPSSASLSAAGRLVVADARCVHALLFGEHRARSRGRRRARARVVLFSVGVAGVPAIHIEEALWVCVETLSAERRSRPKR